MTYGHRDNTVEERLLAWDEENRLTAVCDNGYVSAYLYDAYGERVFKASGDATHMYVDAAEAPGAETDTRSFTLYVSPYLVVCEDGRYTKHFYAGTQRIVSKVGDRASYGSDPRTIDRAGNDYDSQLRVDYEAKKAALDGALAAQYEVFGVPFRGIDHDNRTDAPRRSFADPAEYEGQQYFYHPDHLGSTSYVTDTEGNVAQHVEYVPFGEVLVDQRAADWNAPYLFNAKEFDEETGLYYYGARYYDPRLSLWMSTDPLQEHYSDFSSYCYTKNNPVNLIDFDGEKPTPKEAALLAKHVYGGKDAESTQKALALTGWEVSSFSTSIQKNAPWYGNGLNSELYQRKKGNGSYEYAYVFAGTNSPRDAYEDIQQIKGKSSQYSSAIANAKTLVKELGNKELTFIGHSLGGGEAAAASMATGKLAITFNAAGVSIQTALKHKLGKPHNVYNYITIGKPLWDGARIYVGGDPVNNSQSKVFLSPPGKVIYVPTNSYKPSHGIDWFQNLTLPEYE